MQRPPTRSGRIVAPPGASLPVAPPVWERFAAYLAHELRTPLATQRALLELALADPNTDIAAWRETGEEIFHACRQQERLLEACLTLARSQDSLQRCEPVDLAAVAAETLRAHHPSELESLVALEPAWTSGDPALVERLAANLVSNAIRHNIASGRIEVATHAESGAAVLSVTNTGPQIAAAEIPRLFQPFQRHEASPRLLSDGVGLGLAIVEAIARAHHATITAQPRTRGGLTINVAFPTLDKTEPYRP
jgi:signal transduction histidine kinase